MGETPDELSQSIVETRERMTETVQAIKARANPRRHADDDASTPIGRVTRSVERVLDRVPTEPAAGDSEPAAPAHTSHDAERPGRDPDRSAKGKTSLIVVLACAAAGVFAGLATSPDGARGE
jgi:uncharacterized protein DUF3618